MSGAKNAKPRKRGRPPKPRAKVLAFRRPAPEASFDLLHDGILTFAEGVLATMKAGGTVDAAVIGEARAFLDPHRARNSDRIHEWIALAARDDLSPESRLRIGSALHEHLQDGAMLGRIDDVIWKLEQLTSGATADVIDLAGERAKRKGAQ